MTIADLYAHHATTGVAHPIDGDLIAFERMYNRVS